MREEDIFVVGISSLSGGGKTAVASRLAELLHDAVTIAFDDYDFDTTHPESFRRWLVGGANVNEWKTPKLADDLGKLRTGQAIVSPVDGRTMVPRKYVVFDAPLGYAHTETAGYIDFMVFIDTPLDVAMARRLLRDWPSVSADGSIDGTESLRGRLTAYLDYGRRAYLEMDRQIKPNCDLILDGCMPVDDLVREIAEAIKARNPTYSGGPSSASTLTPSP